MAVNERVRVGDMKTRRGNLEGKGEFLMRQIEGEERKGKKDATTHPPSNSVLVFTVGPRYLMGSGHDRVAGKAQPPPLEVRPCLTWMKNSDSFALLATLSSWTPYRLVCSVL